jgi:hypothetical protein
MKKFIYGIALFTSVMSAQVGIGTATPSGALEVNASLPLPSTQKAGFVPPTVALSATNLTTTTTAGVSVVNPITNGVPTTGTIVYNTSTSAAGANQVTPGYYYWDGSLWSSIKSTSKTTTINQYLPTTTIASTQAVNLGLGGYFFGAGWTPATAIQRQIIGGAGSGTFYVSAATTLTDISLKGWVLITSGQTPSTTIHIMKYSLGTTTTLYANTVTGVSLGTQTLTLTANSMSPIDITVPSASLVAGDVLVCVLIHNSGGNRDYQFGGQLKFTQ